MKKRILSTLLVFAMIFTLIPAAFAAGPYQVVSVDKTSVAPGETVVLKVTMPEGIETAGSFTVRLNFDNTKFEVVSRSKPPKITATDDWGDNDTTNITANTAELANKDGILTAVAAYTLNTMKVAGVTVIEATLKVKEGATGTAAFSFDAFEITKSEGGTQYIVKKDELETLPTITITGAPADPLGGTVAITGLAKYDETLGVDRTGLTGNSDSATLQYQWLRDSADITGATNDTYTLTADDIGKQISVKVTSSAETGAVTSAAVTVGKADKTAPTGVTAVNCTTPDNNNGKITGVTADMEYKKAGDSTYTAISGDEVTNLVPGTYLVRYKETATHNASPDATVTIAEASALPPASVSTAPVAKTGLEYAVIEQELVTAGTATGGTMQYSLNGTNWSTDVPKGKDAKTYTVYYMVKGDVDHSDFTPADNTVTVTIDPKNIGDSDVTVDPIAAETYDGTAKTPAPVVKDGSVPLTSADYTVSYSSNTDAGTATVTIKGQGNYSGQRTENFTINRAAQTITVPTGDQTVSFGNTLDLKTLCSSNAPGATLTFAVKSGSTLPAGTTLSGSTVTAGNIEGTFIVTVNSAAVTNYEAAAEREFTVKIVDLPAASVTTTPAAKTGLVYNGTEQALITAGVATGGTMQYSLDGSTWSDSIPKGKDAKPYTVYYRVKGDASHSDYIPSSNTVSVSIDKKPATVTPKSFTITKGDAIPTFELTYTGLVSGDTLTPSATPTFTCFESDGTTPVSTSTPAGTYTITWTNESTTTFAGEDNYDLTKTATATLTIENPSSGGVSTYAITVKDAENGNVTASRKSASKGTTVTLTVTPDKGYVLDTIKVLDSKDKEIKLTEKDGKFTFAMPASKVTVETSFKAEAPVVKHPFTDVPEGSWYEDAVIWAVDRGITSGTGATTFEPDGICTRAQAVTFLWRAAGSPAPTTVSMPFTDVKAGSWYYDAVLWAVEKDITKGTSDITFSPDLNCSRGQIVTFLWRAAGSPAVSGNAAFTDVVVDAYYADAVLWAVKEGVTNGSSATTFGPDVECSRSQIVTFIYRYMTK